MPVIRYMLFYFLLIKILILIAWHKQHKVVVLVNNGIHPGEPDGIDASMMLLRDLAQGKLKTAKQCCACCNSCL